MDRSQILKNSINIFSAGSKLLYLIYIIGKKKKRILLLALSGVYGSYHHPVNFLKAKNRRKNTYLTFCTDSEIFKTMYM